jgi:hypothetical protein
MSYKVRANYQPLSTAGKITILTAVSSLFIFLAVFLLNLGQSEIAVVQAQQQATTSVNVKNTPPEFQPGGFPQEQVASASTSPTNSGNVLTFIATAADQNLAPYFFIVCDSSSATANPAPDEFSLGTVPPTCDGNQIAVSTSTVSGQQAFAATTTTEAMPEQNDWWAFACDDDPDNPECSPASQGLGGATSSPFVVNHRPAFEINTLNPAGDPGAVITFTASSSDQDTFGGQDLVELYVCTTAAFSTSTGCLGGTIATSTLVNPGPTAPSAATTTAVPLPDDTYAAYVYLMDEHNHAALVIDQGTNAQYTINNVAPTINAGFITLNGGSDMVLLNAAATTSGFTLDFEVSDNNSCFQVDGSSPEIVDYRVSIYHTGAAGTTTCVTAGDYNPNFCYPSTAVPTNWDLNCTASTTAANTCGGTSDATETWSCDFSLWFVADPTDDGAAPALSPFAAADWRAAVSAIDNDGATTSVFTQSSTPDIEVIQFTAFDLNTAEIPFGSLAPGEDTVSVGSSTIPTDLETTGNTGIDVNLSGLLMCPDTFAVGTCPVTSTSSIAVTNQFYQTIPFLVSTSTGVALTGSPTELELDVLKATTTAPGTLPIGTAYWALQIPDSITFAGAYTGRNTFLAVPAETADWTP